MRTKTHERHRLSGRRVTSLQSGDERRGDGRSLYAVDAQLIEELAPDLIVTQDLCAVCAVSSGELASACPVGADLLSLDPRTLSEVVETLRIVARRLGEPERGDEVADRMCAEIDEAAA